MKEYIGKKVLITCQSFFVAPDGKEYRSVFGTLKGIHEAKDQFGFVPSRQHTNWFIEIGDMTITGCQVLYCIKIDTDPVLGPAKGWTYKDDKAIEYERPSLIFQTK